MPPDIQPLALHRINHQRFTAQIFRRDDGLGRERMIRCQHQTDFKIKHRRIVQTAARQDIGRQYEVQLALLQRRLRVKRHAGFEIHHHLRPVLMEVVQRGRQPLNAAVAFDGDTQ